MTAALGLAAAVLLGASLVPPAAAGSAIDGPDQPQLPRVVNTPGTWSDAESVEGPLAALGLALRTRPVGLAGERQALAMFGVSGVDGRSAWVTLPRVDLDERELLDWFALSPDGRWVGWTREHTSRRPRGAGLAGWAVMDTTTGEVRSFDDPAHPRLRRTMSELAFSGDSRYLLTSYETPQAPRSRGHQFVAWDVQTGGRVVLEKPGNYWLPNLGSAPSGVVWSRGDTVHREDPASGVRSRRTLPQRVVTASWGPDDTAFAYIGRRADQPSGPWRLYAGRSFEQASVRALPMPIQPRQLLGWRDERHVVVGHYRRDVHVVDVVTGEVTGIGLAGYGDVLNPPLLAADLWRAPMAEPPTPEDTTDLRRPYRYAGGATALVLVTSLLLRRRSSGRQPADGPGARSRWS